MCLICKRDHLLLFDFFLFSILYSLCFIGVVLNIRIVIFVLISLTVTGASWSWSYGSWIYNYICNQCLSPLKFWVRTLIRRGALETTLFDKVCQLLATGRWFSPGTSVSSTNKTDRHDITEILLKVALNTINLNQNKKIIERSCICVLGVSILHLYPRFFNFEIVPTV